MTAVRGSVKCYPAAALAASHIRTFVRFQVERERQIDLKKKKKILFN